MMILLAQAVFLPIALSPIAYLLGKRFGARSAWFSFVVLLYGTILTLLAGSISSDYIESYDWSPLGTFGLRADGLSIPFAATICILATALTVYSIPYMTHRISEEVSNLPENERKSAFNSKIGLYFAFFLLYTAGMYGAVLATNLIQFYIFFELMLIPSYFLIAEFGYGDRDRISFLYFLWTHIGALILLAGLLTIAFFSGSFDYAGVSDASIPGLVRGWVAAAITIGLFVKLAAFGLHIWLPHAHAEAPAPISALLSPAMIGIGGYALIRFLVFLLPSVYQNITFVIAIWGLVTMIYGGSMALAQDDIKRVLAYSSISQMGYLIFGISTASYIGISGSVLHYVSHGMAKAILFMTAGAIILQTGGIRNISKLGGLASKLPYTATAALIGFLVIIGIPPMIGFQSEWMIFSGAITGAFHQGSSLHLAIAILALVATPLTAGYALLTMKRVFFGKLPDHLSSVREASPIITGPLLFLASLSVILGIYPSIVNDRIVPLLWMVLGV
ncbi:MAG: formate hydrogenlyase [Thaumarchaeota archaeon]|nr:formate hydrogenlyase [Nitrososphaerota archaeon]